VQKGLIVVPAYNEERNIDAVIQRLRLCDYPESILVVNDGSRDGTLSVLAGMNVPYVSHPVNLGYVRALQTGIRFADEHGYDYIVFIDADGQHDPHQIAELKAVGLAQQGPDIVIGSRFVSERRYRGPLGRRLGMMLFSWLTARLGGKRIYDTTSGFKLIHRRVFAVMCERMIGDFHAEMIVFALLAGLKIEEVPIAVAERRHGVSMYGWLESLVYPIKTLLAISVLWPQARRERRRLSVAQHA
jgi:glycosyltransferase involved in cell wall biosynthesis